MFKVEFTNTYQLMVSTNYKNAFVHHLVKNDIGLFIPM